jgi:acyl-CoA thioesterase
VNEKLDHIVAKDHLAKLLGIEIESLEEGRACVKMEARVEHCNGLDIVHGGTIFTLADFAFAAACNSHGVPAVGINANISYIKAAKPGMLYADAREVNDAKIGLCEVRVTDGDKNLIAMFQGLSYRRQK